MCEQWDHHYEEQVRQMHQRLDELVSGTAFEQIEGLLAQLGDKDKLIVDLSKSLHDMRNEVLKASPTKSGNKSPSDSAQLAEAEAHYQEKIGLYRQILNEKAILYDQLQSSARQLINRDDIVLKNEAEIVKLRYEIDL